MNSKENTSKQGQAIVIMAFAIIALAALVGLAIDGGNLYTLRRRVQIGADSTAMAGTQMLADLISQCATPSVAQDTAIRNQILEYARHNGVDEFSATGDVVAWYINKDGTDLGFVGAGVPIPTGATGIRTRLVTTDTTTFMRLFNIPHISAPGEATAVAGQVLQVGGGGLLPIAVWDEVVKNITFGTEFTVKDSGEFKDFCTVTCPSCCEGNVESSSQRGWLQLAHIYNKDKSIMRRAFTTSMNSGSGCKPLHQAGLDQWLNPTCMYPHSIYAGQPGMDNGDFIAGATGSMTSGDHSIKDHWLGKVIYAPVFDLIYSGTDQKANPRMETIFPSDHPQPINTWVQGSSNYYYHITGFVAIKLLRYEGQGSKDLVGEFQYASIQAGQINPGAGLGSGSACTPGLVGFSLID
jgi:hypothetical protein